MNTSALLRVQVGVAALAIAATVGAALKLGPTTQKLIDLHSEIAQLEAKKLELQRTNDAITGNATPAAAGTGRSVGWLYLGRVNSDKSWAPAAEGVQPAPNSAATEKIKTVAVTKNVPYVQHVDGAKVDVADFKPTANKGPVRLVSAGTSLDVLDTKYEASAGGASFVWVKVSIPASAILEIPGKNS